MRTTTLTILCVVLVSLTACSHRVPEGCPEPESVVGLLKQLGTERWQTAETQDPRALWPTGFTTIDDLVGEGTKECPEDTVYVWEGRVIRGQQQCAVTLHYFPPPNSSPCGSRLMRVLIHQTFPSERAAFAWGQRNLDALLSEPQHLSRSWFQKNNRLNQQFSGHLVGSEQVYVDVSVSKEAAGYHVGIEIVSSGPAPN